MADPHSWNANVRNWQEQFPLVRRCFDMKSIYVSGLTPNDVITAQFLVLTKEVRQKKTGEPYLHLHLADKSGEIEAKMWDNVTDVLDAFERDDFVKVKGLMQLYNKRSQFTIHKLRRLADEEVDFADYFPCADRPVDEMWAELTGIIDGLGNAHLQALLRSIFADEQIASRYRLAPAAKNIHHACRGGLLQHVLSLCSLARLVGSHYKDVDLDLVVTGAILHDIGKIEELTYTRSFGYSAEGQLLGHIVIGLRMVSEKLNGLPNFPPKLRTLLEHMIVSHHGELEFGSPKVPLFPDALLLHHLDNLDSKMEAMRTAIMRDAVSENEFTGWIPSLERVVLRKSAYLNGPVPSQLPLSVNDDGEHAPPPAFDEPKPVPSTPQTVQPEMPKRENKPAPRPAAPTLFGEKLQAVLSAEDR